MTRAVGLLLAASIPLLSCRGGAPRGSRRGAEHGAPSGRDGAASGGGARPVPAAPPPFAILEPRSGVWGVTAMSFARDGSLAVGVGSVIRLWRAGDYQETRRVGIKAPTAPQGSTRPPPPRIAGLAFSPDSQTLVASASGGRVVSWSFGAVASGDAPAVGWEAPASVAADGTAMSTLVYSPDGQRLVGRSWDSATVPAWSVASRAPSPTLEFTRRGQALLGPRGSAGDPGFRPALLAFGPASDGVWGVCDRDLVRWSFSAPGPEVAQVLKARAPQGGTDALVSVAVDPQGRRAVTGSEGGRILLWDLKTGSVIRWQQTTHANPQVAFSRGGERVAVAFSDGAIQTFASPALTPLASYDPPQGWTEATALDGDARLVAIAGEGMLTIRDLVSGHSIEAERPALRLSAVAVDPATTHLAFGIAAGVVAVLELPGGDLRWLHGHTDQVTALAFSADGRWLASASRDKTTRLWDVGTGKGVRALEHPGPVNAVVFLTDSSSENRLVTGSEDGSVRVWEARSGKILATPEGSRCPILSLALSVDGMLTAYAADRALLRWDAHSYAAYARHTAGDRRFDCAGELRAGASSAAFTADGRQVATVGGGAVELWNARTGEVEKTLASETTPAFHGRAVAVSPLDGRMVAAGDDTLRGWQLPRGNDLPEMAMAAHADGLVFSGDGRFLFSLGRQSVWVWKVGPAGAGLSLLLRLGLTGQATDHAAGVAASPDGHLQGLGGKLSSKQGARCVGTQRVLPFDTCAARMEATDLLGTTFGHPAADVSARAR